MNIVRVGAVDLGAVRSRTHTGVAKRLAKRNDRGVRGRENEGEFYREIVSRAKNVRERAAESLRVSRRSRKKRGDKPSQRDVTPTARGSRRKD
jgi:hypothetical protein